MSAKLTQFLEQELSDRGWSIRELARRSRLSVSTVSDVINGHSAPGTRFCNGIARALDVPPERIFRIAEILPSRIIGNENTEREMLDYFRAMDPKDQQQILTITRALYESRAEYTTDEEADK